MTRLYGPRPQARHDEASPRKPYNHDAGYVASRKCVDGGHVVIYDRENGGAWIDGDARWILARYNAHGFNEGLLEFTSQRSARDLMKDTATGAVTDWYDATDLEAWEPVKEVAR